MAELTKREQVKECIALGTMTKAEIAEKLEMTPGSVSSQMTYLRWMDNYILTDSETKILSFTDKETYEAAEAEKKSNSKTKAAARTPEERSVAVAKTIANQEKSLAKWEVKVVTTQELIDALPEEEENADLDLDMIEAKAQVALFGVKIARNKALAGTLPDPEESAAKIAAEAAEAEAAEGAEGSDPEGVEADAVEEGEDTDELL